MNWKSRSKTDEYSKAAALCAAELPLWPTCVALWVCIVIVLEIKVQAALIVKCWYF